MAESWDDVRGEIRAHLLDTSTLVRAVAAGRRRGVALQWRRAELRPVQLKGGVRLQVTAYDDRQAHTDNYGDAEASAAVDVLLDQGFGNWHVETTTEVLQVRITKKGDAQVHRDVRGAVLDASPARHDRVKPRLFDVAHPDVLAFLTAVGVADAQGRIKPTKQDKYRQVEEFLRLLDTAVADARTAGTLDDPTAENPWRLVDLGCGNAYLTFAAYTWLVRVRGLAVHVHGVDVRESLCERNNVRAAELGWGDGLTFETATIQDAAAGAAPQIVVALHACDTATDDALALAVRAGAAVVLAAPCCHHDLQSQVSRSTSPAPYALVTRHGLLSERLLDVLTDAVRASILRTVGYRVDTVQFVSDEHTPRNLMLRAVRTGSPAQAGDLADYDALVAQWGVTPSLATQLAPELEAARARTGR